MMKKIDDTKLLVCLDGLQVFLGARIKENEDNLKFSGDAVRIIKKILKNEKMNVDSAVMIYDQIRAYTEAAGIEIGKIEEPILLALFMQWEYIKNWIISNFAIYSDSEMVIIKNGYDLIVEPV